MGILTTFFCKIFKKHLQKHGLDTIVYCDDPKSLGNMISLYTNHPKFLIEEVKKQNNNVNNSRYTISTTSKRKEKQLNAF